MVIEPGEGEGITLKKEEKKKSKSSGGPRLGIQERRTKGVERFGRGQEKAGLGFGGRGRGSQLANGQAVDETAP